MNFSLLLQSSTISDKAYRQGAWLELKKKVNEHLVEKGVEPIADDFYMCVQISPHLVSGLLLKRTFQKGNEFKPFVSSFRTSTAIPGASTTYNSQP